MSKDQELKDKELKDKVAIVTGGSGAIGSAICACLQDAGATVFSLDVQNPSDQSNFIACDIREENSVRDAIAQVQSRHGRIDIAVHAAGVSRNAVVWKQSVDDWDLIQDVNLRGAFLLMHHAVPLMRSGERGGRIVLIGSINGSRGKFGTSAYSASKAGLLGLMKSVARETGRFGVLVNTIEPGWVKTPMTDAVSQDVRDAALKESLIGRFLVPQDISSAVRFLCGPSSAGITGQVIRVDGGQFLGPV